MPKSDVHKPGLAIAFVVTMLATAVGIVSQATETYSLHTFCLTCYGCAIVILSGAVVNFEPARILK